MKTNAMHYQISAFKDEQAFDLDDPEFEETANNAVESDKIANKLASQGYVIAIYRNGEYVRSIFPK